MSKEFDFNKVDETCRELADENEQIQYLIEVGRNQGVDDPLEWAECTLNYLKDLWAEEKYQILYGDSM